MADTTLPAAPKFKESSAFLGQAKKEVEPLYQPQIQAAEARLPLLQQRYDMYLERLSTAGEERRGELETKQLADVSRTGSAAATRGLRGGLVEAQVRGVETTYDKLINSLTTDIESQKKELGISREEQQTEIQGMIASLVGQKASKIQETARALSLEDLTRRQSAFENLLSLATAAHEREMAAWEKQMKQKELSFEQQRIGLEAQRVNILSKQEKDKQADAVVSTTAKYINELYDLARRKGVTVTDKAVENRVKTLLTRYPAFEPEIRETFEKLTGYGSKGGTLTRPKG